jgi:hypothetical protein
VARRARGERGASLVLALGFLALCGALIPAIATLGSTNLADTGRLQSQRSVNYATDGAIDATIQYLRVNTGCGRKFGDCALPVLDPETKRFDTKVNNQDVTVHVKPGASANPFDLDREISLAAFVDGKDRVDATVVINDSQAVGSVDAGHQPVDVKRWTYNR